ncbi:related to Heat shock protein STI1 [Hanseniaspora guilliermondii]|uniref:Related to Heat shock protein STI1 n=1 Tax=Hanseniaspora guilliermondii TaxID=56406 RepID=A0A1L0AZC2_9ASCO|nr:related to Heat shock protein STI1 [Hanseniaspora guilliermondii]
MSSAEIKASADQAFKSKQYTEAINLYKQAVSLSTDNAEKSRIYSNMSAANYSAMNFEDALNNAKSAIDIDPLFSKAYGRAATACLGLGKNDEAIEHYQQYLRLDPNSAIAKKGLEDAIKAKNLLSSKAESQIFNELQEDPEVMKVFSDPAFMQALMSNDTKILSDPKYAKALKLASDLQQKFKNTDTSSFNDELKETPKKTEKQAFKTMNKELKEEEKTGSPNSESEKELLEKKQSDDKIKKESIELKNKGNELYKKKLFDEAIEYYTKAFDTYKDVLYLTNIAAATLESGKCHEALQILNEAVDFAKETHVSYEIMGKIYHKIANVYIKMDNKEEALNYLKKSLTEDRKPDVLNKKKNLEKEIKITKEKAYLSKDKALEASNAGKDLFAKQNYAEAVKMFDEAIKRDPSDYKHYSNRSACLFKLLAFPDCIRDCETVMEKEPSFIKVYIRKAQCLLAMQKYAAAIITISKAMDQSPSASESTTLANVKYEINSAIDRRLNNNTLKREDLVQAALSEPEIRDIVQDPVMVNILEQAKTDPSVIMQHYQNPTFSKRIQLLADVGIISTH